MNLKARFILEAMGQPESLVKKTLEAMLDSIKKTQKVEDSFIEKPKLSGEKFYTSFMEITISFKNVPQLFEFITLFTPTIVEILEPYKFEMNAGELENICNDVMGKIHALDKNYKSAMSVNKLLQNKVLQNNTDNKI